MTDPRYMRPGLPFAGGTQWLERGDLRGQGSATIHSDGPERGRIRARQVRRHNGLRRDTARSTQAM